MGKNIKMEGFRLFLKPVPAVQGIPPTLYLFPILWKNISSSFNKIFQIVTSKFLYHQIDIKLSCLQEKPMCALF